MGIKSLLTGLAALLLAYTGCATEPVRIPKKPDSGLERRVNKPEQRPVRSQPEKTAPKPRPSYTPPEKKPAYTPPKEEPVERDPRLTKRVLRILFGTTESGNYHALERTLKIKNINLGEMYHQIYDEKRRPNGTLFELATIYVSDNKHLVYLNAILGTERNGVETPGLIDKKYFDSIFNTLDSKGKTILDFVDSEVDRIKLYNKQNHINNTECYSLKMLWEVRKIFYRKGARTSAELRKQGRTK